MPRRHPADPGPDPAIGARIAEARRAAGLTQRELAKAVGVSERAVQAWEEGTTSAFRRLPELEQALGSPSAWLLTGDASAALKALPGIVVPHRSTFVRRLRPDEVKDLPVSIESRVALLEEEVAELRD